MFGIGMPELIIILVIMVIIVGPGKLPQLGSSLGGAIRGFKKAAEGEPATIDGDQHKKTEV
jgi:sec-independent protein translocase protein TatA